MINSLGRLFIQMLNLCDELASESCDVCCSSCAGRSCDAPSSGERNTLRFWLRDAAIFRNLLRRNQAVGVVTGYRACGVVRQ